MKSNVAHLQPTGPDERLRRQFRASVKTDRKDLWGRAKRRKVYAALTGLGTYAAIKGGAPAALRRVAAFERGMEAGLGKLYTHGVAGKIPFLRRFVNAERSNASLEAGAAKFVGIRAARESRRAINAAAKHTGRVALGAAGFHYGAGTARDFRKTRREQGRFARRLLLL